MTTMLIVTTGTLGNKKSELVKVNHKSEKGLNMRLTQLMGRNTYNTESGKWTAPQIAKASDNDKWIAKRNNEKLCIPANGYIR